MLLVGSAVAWGCALALIGPSACSTTAEVIGTGQVDGASDAASTNTSDACVGEACMPKVCNASCDCAATGQACIRGTCGAVKDSCEYDTDCSCDRYCLYANDNGHCESRCNTNADCKDPKSAFCYLPMGKCGPCINDAQCGTGNHCTAGVCASGEAGAPQGPCENSSQCTPKDPVCPVPGSTGAGSCGPCYLARLQCGDMRKAKLLRASILGREIERAAFALEPSNIQERVAVRRRAHMPRVGPKLGMQRPRFHEAIALRGPSGLPR